MTWLDAEERSAIVSDRRVPGAIDCDGYTINKHWIVERMPKELNEEVNPAEQLAFEIDSIPGGAQFQIWSMDPSEVRLHKTETLGFLVVVSGELALIMEEGGEPVLHPGDGAIQRATNHAWAYRGEQTCVLPV